jgi:hypothetical protein
MRGDSYAHSWDSGNGSQNNGGGLDRRHGFGCPCIYCLAGDVPSAQD